MVKNEHLKRSLGEKHIRHKLYTSDNFLYTQFFILLLQCLRSGYMVGRKKCMKGNVSNTLCKLCAFSLCLNLSFSHSFASFLIALEFTGYDLECIYTHIYAYTHIAERVLRAKCLRMCFVCYFLSS